MRNRNKINQLGRTASHRNALMMNLANSLIQHKRITTTLAKAKALRGYVEPLITKSKDDTTHSRRMVFKHLQSKDAVTELFREVAPKVADRPGGYTRIIKIGFRAGDAAEMCMIELVDFNEIYTTDAKAAGAKKTRRSRRGSGTTTKAQPKAEAPSEAKTEEAVATAEVKEENPATEEAKAEEVKVEASEATPEEKPEATESDENTEEASGNTDGETEKDNDEEKKGDN